MTPFVKIMLGATAVVVAAEVGQLSFLVIWSTLALVLGIRIAAIVFDLHAPTPIPSRGDAA